MWKKTATLTLGILCAVSLEAMAQPGEGPPPGGPGGRPGPARMTPEQSEAIWTLQAANVATRLALSEEAATQLGETYKNVRKELSAASRAEIQPPSEGQREGRGGRGRGRGGMMEAHRELTATYRAKLKTALAGFLAAEQAGKAVELLGSFDFQWDRMVQVLAGFKLGADQDAALALVNDYVAQRVKFRLEAGPPNEEGADPREAMRARKAALDEALSALLSAEQLDQWKVATAQHGRRGGRGRGPQGNTE
jgi:hypothetical protein